MSAETFYRWYLDATAKGIASTVGQRMMADSPNWSVDHTGGGCLAWLHTIGDGEYIWITAEDGASLGDSLDEVYCIGVYGADGETYECHYAESLDAALALARKYRNA